MLYAAEILRDRVGKYIMSRAEMPLCRWVCCMGTVTPVVCENVADAGQGEKGKAASFAFS